MNDYIINDAVSEFKKYYTEQLSGKNTGTTNDEFLFARLCSLQTKTQHDISLIFFAGFIAGIKSCKNEMEKSIEEIFKMDQELHPYSKLKTDNGGRE